MPEDKSTILVVDDDPDILEFTRIVLQSGGYRVVCFTDTDKAFTHMTQQPPNLVITDLMMGALDSGFSFIEQIRAQSDLAHLPIIIITAVNSQRGFDFEPRNEEDLAAMQAQAFFAKPVEPRDLLTKVRNLLARST